MAKYTASDPDIEYLDKYDRINYNFDLLKFDVDKNQEPHIGAKSVTLLTDPSKIGEMFKSPVKFTVGLFALVVFVLTVVLIIYLVVMLILKIVGGPENDMRLAILKEMFIYFISALIVLVILYVFINKTVTETTPTGFLPQ